MIQVVSVTGLKLCEGSYFEFTSEFSFSIPNLSFIAILVFITTGILLNNHDKEVELESQNTSSCVTIKLIYTGLELQIPQVKVVFLLQSTCMVLGFMLFQKE
jgi:hypothetical protein